MSDVPTNLPLLDLPEAGLRPLLLAVQECLDDDLPRRALADWLEEHGDARAVLIRAGLAGDGRRVARWVAVYGERWLGSLPHGARVEAPEGLITLCWPGDGSEPQRRLRLAAQQGWVARLVLGGGMGWYDALMGTDLFSDVSRLRWAHANQWALEELPLRAVRELDLSGSPELEAVGLGSLRQLEVLRLDGCPQVGEVWSQEAPALRELSLRGCPRVTDTVVATLGQHPNLRTLDLSGCLGLEGASLQALRSMGRLECLRLADGVNVRHVRLADFHLLARLDLCGCARLEEVHLSRLPCLTHLDLCGCALVTVLRVADLLSLPELPAAGLQQLARVEARGLPEVGAIDLRDRPFLQEASFSDLTSLHSLDLGGCDELDRLELAALPRLEGLYARGCRKLPGRAVAQLARFPALRHLDLGHCSLVEALSLRGLSHLEELKLDGCAALRSLTLTNLPSLRRLEAAACAGLGDAALEAAAGLPALRVLDVRGITLSGEAIARAAWPAGLQVLLLGDDAGPEEVRLGGLPALRLLRMGPWRAMRRFELAGPSEVQALDLACRPLLRAARLRDLSSLRELTLQGCRKLATLELAELPELRVVHLGDCERLGDAAVAGLAALPRLETLHLTGARNVSRAAVQELRARLPRCRVQT